MPPTLETKRGPVILPNRCDLFLYTGRETDPDKIIPVLLVRQDVYVAICRQLVEMDVSVTDQQDQIIVQMAWKFVPDQIGNETIIVHQRPDRTPIEYARKWFEVHSKGQKTLDNILVLPGGQYSRLIIRPYAPLPK